MNRLWSQASGASVAWLCLGGWLTICGLLMEQARAERPDRDPPVPPTREIEILDPNVDPNGLPAVQLKPDPNCPDNRSKVDIPPVIIVHRYYYTGDRKFQGPMLPGGPSIVVANHPRTGARCYVEAQLLPGAPQVTYSERGIEYEYGKASITIDFPRWGEPRVTFRNGPAMGSRVVDAAESTREKSHALVERMGLPEAAEKAKSATKSATIAAADGLRAAGKAAATPLIKIVQVFPMGKWLTDSKAAATRQAERGQKLAVQKATQAASSITIP